MKVFISKEEIFMTYDQRSIDSYHPMLAKHIASTFGTGNFSDEATVRIILEEYYDWCAVTFQEIVSSQDDWGFLSYLFAFHESSILLWMRTIRKEDLQSRYGFSDDDLSLNRRIFKLVLEQACEINYIHFSRLTPKLMHQYDALIQDLFYDCPARN